MGRDFMILKRVAKEINFTIFQLLLKRIALYIATFKIN